MINRIQKEYLDARKKKDSVKTNLLCSVVSDILARAKKDNREPNDNDCVSVVKKFIKSAEEILTFQSENQDAIYEIKLLTDFLPRQLNEEELNAIITEYITELGPKMGPVMKKLKENFNGLYDGKTANQIVNSKIQ